MQQSINSHSTVQLFGDTGSINRLEIPPYVVGWIYSVHVCLTLLTLTTCHQQSLIMLLLCLRGCFLSAVFNNNLQQRIYICKSMQLLTFKCIEGVFTSIHCYKNRPCCIFASSRVGHLFSLLALPVTRLPLVNLRC